MLTYTEECLVCLLLRPSVLHGPCQHVCVCKECDERVKKKGMSCPLCLSPIRARTFMDEEGGWKRYADKVGEEELQNWEMMNRLRYLQRLNAPISGTPVFAATPSRTSKRRKEPFGEEPKKKKQKEVSTIEDRLGCLNGNGLTTYVQEGDALVVSFRPPGHAQAVLEAYTFCVQTDLLVVVGMGLVHGESVSELAARDLRALYLLHYHYGDVEEGMRDLIMCLEAQEPQEACSAEEEYSFGIPYADN